MGMLCFVTERDWGQESFYGNNTMGVIWFHLSFTFLVLSLKNTASTFPEIFFPISILPLWLCILWCPHLPNLHTTKTSTSLKSEKDIQKRKTPFFGILKGLSNRQQLFFISYALNWVQCKYGIKAL